MLHTLDEHLRRIPKGHVTFFKDDSFKCKHCREEMLHPGHFVCRSSPVIVISLKHGPFRASFFDWTCSICGKWNFYSGRHDGIFPVRRRSTYCTEFLYTVLDLVCRLGIPFRRAFESIKTSSFMNGLLFDHVRQSKVPITESKGTVSRQRVTEAFGWFLMSMSISRQEQSGQLFHCNDCEYP